MFQDEQLTFWRLTRRGKYVRTPRSSAFPLLTCPVLNELLRQRFERSENQLVRALVGWLRKQKPRRHS